MLDWVYLATALLGLLLLAYVAMMIVLSPKIVYHYNYMHLLDRLIAKTLYTSSFKCSWLIMGIVPYWILVSVVHLQTNQTRSIRHLPPQYYS